MNVIRIAITTALYLPLLSHAGFIEDTKAETRKSREEEAIASLGHNYVIEVKQYRARPDRGDPKCYVTASANWTMWTGLPKAAFEACDEVVQKEILAIREAHAQVLAAARAERAEKRKGMSEVAAKLDEIYERQQDRVRELDRKDTARQAKADEITAAQGKVSEADTKFKSAKRLSSLLGNTKDC